MGFPLLILALVVPVIIFRADIWRLFTSVQKLEAWVRASGPTAPLVFIALQIFQIVVFVVPGEVVQITGGYLFGTWPATLYSVTGIAIGSAAAFFLGRVLGVPFVNAIFPPERVEGARKLLSTPGSKLVFFLLFVIPGIPKDVLCYVAGLSPLRFPFFILASMVGRLPGIIGSALIGNSAAQKKWVLAAIVLGVAVILFSAGFFFRERIEKLLRRIGSRGKE
ncbi:MAG: VTT domain-containing protein [Spirochaetia bacterium]